MDNSKAVCKQCNVELARCKPDKPKTFSTTSLISHLRSKHPVQYDEMNSRKTAIAVAAEGATATATATSNAHSDSSTLPRSGSNLTAQPGIRQAFDKLKLWDINSENAQRVHVAIAKMIAIDMEPYHVVEKPGFVNLVQTLEKRYSMPSRKYFTERVIPDLFETVNSRLKDKVAGALSIAFSTDTWTTDNMTESYFGLTAHWLTDTFERRELCFALCQVYGPAFSS